MVWRHDNHVILLPDYSSNLNLKLAVIVAFLSTSGVVWTENIFMSFQSEISVFKFLRQSVWTKP